MRGKKRWDMDESFIRFVNDEGQRTDGKPWGRAGMDCFGYVSEILQDCQWQRRNGKPLSQKSKTEYGNAILASFTELKELGYPLGKPWNFEQKHIEALCQLWASRGRSAATVQNRLTSLSWFGALMSRPGMIQSTHSYDEQFGDVDMRRHQLATREKSPEGVGITRDEVISKAMSMDTTFGHMVMLQFALGLRNKEVLRARPLTDDHGTHWEMPPSIGGSKGGRARVIPLIQGTWQREAIDTVKAFIRKRNRGVLKAPMGWSKGKPVKTSDNRTSTGLKYDMNRYKALLEKCGFTRRTLGFAGHAMRHSFVQEQYQTYGLISSVKVDENGVSGYLRHAEDGRPVDKSDRALVDRANKAVMESMGHGRKSAAGSYYGRMVFAKPEALSAEKTGKPSTVTTAGPATPGTPTGPENNLSA